MIFAAQKAYNAILRCQDQHTQRKKLDFALPELMYAVQNAILCCLNKISLILSNTKSIDFDALFC
jgi:hypothetical protein